MLGEGGAAADADGVFNVTHTPSSLLPYSIEAFFTEADVARVLRCMDACKASDPGRLQAGAHGISVHTVYGRPLREVIAIYEPEGRVEINAQRIPREVIDIAECAFYRHIEDIRRAYPAAHGLYGFTYVEYAVGQFFTAHIDGGVDRQIAGLGVTLTNNFEGGEFIVQTCGSNRLWMTDQSGQATLAPGHDSSSDWFRSLPKTDWMTRPISGNAVFYGSALTHACRPVTKGVLKKLLAFVR